MNLTKNEWGLFVIEDCMAEELIQDHVRLYATCVQYPNEKEHSEAKLLYEMYLFPGFTNRSCIPSASRFYAGKSMSVIATRSTCYERCRQ